MLGVREGGGSHERSFCRQLQRNILIFSDRKSKEHWEGSYGIPWPHHPLKHLFGLCSIDTHVANLALGIIITLLVRGRGGMGERRRERTGAEVREREHYPIAKESPCWCIAIKTHTNKSLHQFIIVRTDRILSANIFHSHNGSYVSFCHSHSHSTKAITDCSVLSGVWQSFAKGTQRGQFGWWVSYWCWKEGVRRG